MTEWVKCHDCDGSGDAEDEGADACPECCGEGWVLREDDDE